MLKSFFSYIKSPTVLDEKEVQKIRYIDVIWISFVGYLLMLSLVLFVAVFLLVPLELLHLMPEKIAVDSSSINILIVVLFAPVMEELIFRLPLRFNRWYLLIAIVLPVFLFNKSDLPKAFLLCSLVFAVGAFLIYYKKFNVVSSLKYLWDNYYPFVFYFFVLAFGLAHIGNYTNLSFHHYLLAPVIVLPQLIMGLCFSYVRVKYDKGLAIAILMHILLNGGTCLLVLLKGGERLL